MHSQLRHGVEYFLDRRCLSKLCVRLEKTHCLACGVVALHRKWYHARPKEKSAAENGSRELVD
jgi:hypothetical protein